MGKLQVTLLKYIKSGLLLVLALVLAYFVCAWLFSIIPVNRIDKAENSIDNSIDIYIQSNGVHLDIVVPLVNELKNWTDVFNTDSLIAEQAKYISFGWGDRAFYLDTRNWSDLTVKTAVNAMFFQSPSAMHVDYYKTLELGDKCKLISINEQQYKELVKYIESGFKLDSNGCKIEIEGVRYFYVDSFYEANGSYNIFFTCNTWSNNCLKEAGLKACLWTPFDKGILYQYRR